MEILVQVIAGNLESQCQDSVSMNAIHATPETDLHKELAMINHRFNKQGISSSFWSNTIGNFTDVSSRWRKCFQSFHNHHSVWNSWGNYSSSMDTTYQPKYHILGFLYLPTSPKIGRLPSRNVPFQSIFTLFDYTESNDSLTIQLEGEWSWGRIKW